MARYYFDPDIFGYPQYGLAFEPEQEFIRGGPQNVGSGQYKLLDAFAPTSVRLSWKMRDHTLSLFQEAWQDPTKLNFGALWFNTMLPLGLKDGSDQIQYSMVRAHFSGMYSASLIGYKFWDVSGTMEIDANALP